MGTIKSILRYSTKFLGHSYSHGENQHGTIWRSTVWALALLTLSFVPAMQLEAQEDKALYIDPEGKVIVSGTIQADQVETEKLSGKAVKAIREKLNGKLDKSGGAVSGNLKVRGAVRSSFDPMHHRMYPGDPIVYQDIFDAKQKNVISRLGTAPYDDTSHTNANRWMGRPIIKFGGKNDPDGSGAQVTIPEGYDTLWIRVLGDRWNAVHVYYLDGKKEDLGNWTGGMRAANCYCPDGSLSDGHFNQNKSGYQINHQWVPIPVLRAGKLALTSKPHTNHDFWLSGIAFSKNPWSHAAQSALGIHWNVNGGGQVEWESDNWHSDVLARIGANSVLKVPVIPNGRDKLLYLIEHNNAWNGCMHNGITVNGHKTERFLSTYDNPFARHWNSKIYERYIAARIPANLIPNDSNWLTVKIDMSQQNKPIYFREIGTHDLVLPLE